jgi:outer membrane scaffolding protein for murein synthesis (MipA/OmpV family)
MKFTLPLLLSSLLCGAHAAASAKEPLWEAGALGLAVSQQAYPGADQQVQRGLLLPYLLYRGRYLRADGETAGLRAVHTPRFEFDIGFSGSFGSGGRDIEARRGLPHLGTLVEVGPRLKWNLAGESGAPGRWRALFPLRAVADLSDRGAHRGWAFEPELLHDRRLASGWRMSLGAGAIFADRRLAQTFYGVEPAQALPDRPAYAAQRGLVAWRLSSSFSKPLTPDWRLFGFARLQSVAGAANADSPLVRQRGGLSAGIGLSYTFARSGESGAD